MKNTISIVIPLYSCASSIKPMYNKLKEVFTDINVQYQIVYVNDASPQNDWQFVKNIAYLDKSVKAINLSRNFGQHYAITAGLTYATGNWVVVMDGDLQDNPEEIKNLYNTALSNQCQIVFAQRSHRKDDFFKKITSKLFFKVFSYFTEVKQDSSIGNFGIYHISVIQAILSMKDNIRFFPIMAQWVGFESTAIPVEHQSRDLGISSYTFKKLINLAFDNIISFSNKPLRLVVKFGFYLVLFSFFIAIYYLFQFYKGNIEVLGYSSLIVSIWFLSGSIISILGIIGLYLGKTFDKVKGRPTFIVKEAINI